MSVKIQYAGIAAHVAIIRLLRHLDKKYFTAFQMYDEGSYWETSNEQLLREQFDKYNAAIQSIAYKLKHFITEETESLPNG